MIFRGQVPRPPMRSYCAKWKEAQSIGPILLALIGFPELMLNVIPPVANRIGLETKTSNANRGSVKLIRLARASTMLITT